MSATANTTAEKPSGGFRMVQVRRACDAVGAYCLDCQRGIGEPWQTFPWSWRKSQKLHERGSGHKTIMYKLV